MLYIISLDYIEQVANEIEKLIACLVELSSVMFFLLICAQSLLG